MLGLIGSEKSCENTGEHELRQVEKDKHSFKFACYCEQKCCTYNPIRGGFGPGGGLLRSTEWTQAWKDDKSTDYSYAHEKAVRKALADAAKALLGRVFPGPYVPHPLEPLSEEEERKEFNKWTEENNRTWDEMKEKCATSCAKN